MGFWQHVLALAAGAIWAACFGLPRGRRWIEVAAASFVLSTAYARTGWSSAPIFTLCCDAAVCLALYARANTAWEIAIFNVFRLSLLLSLIYSMGDPLGQIGLLQGQFDHRMYVVGLETCNWLVLLIIGGRLGRKGLADGLAPSYPRLAACVRNIIPGGAARRKPPFWESSQ
ncbi:hypothetical protein [Allorhizobium undicola]|uniref:hypothetical protein n=1 Tax=Allorhizobium undicola TaxID=78527 RepID=UPI0004870C06|nr:hypothetical protein [Allorhizobium undicola]